MGLGFRVCNKLERERGGNRRANDLNAAYKHHNSQNISLQGTPESVTK